MSGKMIRLAWQSDGVGGMDKLVLLALADHANKADEAWPSVASLAEKCGVSESTVKRCLRRLREGGLIEWSSTRNGNLYRFNLTPQGGQPDPGQSDPRVNLTLGMGQPDLSGRSRLAHNHKEPSLNHHSLRASAREEILEPVQTESDTVSHLPGFPELAKSHLRRLVPDLTAANVAEWQDAWHLTCGSRQRVQPGLSIIEYLMDCRRKSIRPEPTGFTRWFSRAEQFAREDEVKASQAGTVEADQPKKWWE